MTVTMIWHCDFEGCNESLTVAAAMAHGELEEGALNVPEPFQWIGGWRGKDDWILCPRHYHEVNEQFWRENPDAILIA